jgi:hypothetical protein
MEIFKCQAFVIKLARIPAGLAVTDELSGFSGLHL